MAIARESIERWSAGERWQAPTTEDVATKEIVYKTTPQGELKLHVFSPAGEVQIAALRPCVVFFFGGGWKSGSYLQFVPQAEYLASRGIVAACADYRILSIHHFVG